MAGDPSQFKTIPAVIGGILSAVLVPSAAFLLGDPHPLLSLVLIIGSLFLAARFIGTSGDRAWMRFWAVIAGELWAMMLGGVAPPADPGFAGVMFMLAVVATSIWGILRMARRHNEKAQAASPAPIETTPPQQSPVAEQTEA